MQCTFTIEKYTQVSAIADKVLTNGYGYITRPYSGPRCIVLTGHRKQIRMEEGEDDVTALLWISEDGERTHLVVQAFPMERLGHVSNSHHPQFETNATIALPAELSNKSTMGNAAKGTTRGISASFDREDTAMRFLCSVFHRQIGYAETESAIDRIAKKVAEQFPSNTIKREQLAADDCNGIYGFTLHHDMHPQLKLTLGVDSCVTENDPYIYLRVQPMSLCTHLLYLMEEDEPSPLVQNTRKIELRTMNAAGEVEEKKLAMYKDPDNADTFHTAIELNKRSVAQLMVDSVFCRLLEKDPQAYNPTDTEPTANEDDGYTPPPSRSNSDDGYEPTPPSSSRSSSGITAILSDDSDGEEERGRAWD
jgi:hypothetical protein